MTGLGDSSAALSNKCFIAKLPAAGVLSLRFFLRINTMAMIQMIPRGTRMLTTIAVVFEEDGLGMTVTPLGRGTVLSIGVEELVEVARAVVELVVEVMKVEEPVEEEAEPVEETAEPVEDPIGLVFGMVVL